MNVTYTDAYKKLKTKMRDILQSCASQQQVSHEAYTEVDKDTGMISLQSVDYSVRRIYKCDICNIILQVTMIVKNIYI